MLKNLNQPISLKVSEDMIHLLKAISRQHGSVAITRLARIALWEFVIKYKFQVSKDGVDDAKNEALNAELNARLAGLDEVDSGFSMGWDGNISEEAAAAAMEIEKAERFADDGQEEPPVEPLDEEIDQAELVNKKFEERARKLDGKK